MVGEYAATWKRGSNTIGLGRGDGRQPRDLSYCLAQGCREARGLMNGHTEFEADMPSVMGEPLFQIF